MRAKILYLTGILGLMIATPASPQMNQSSMDAMMANWSPSSKKAAMMMMQKYGPPQEMTPTMAMWRDNGPWKFTKISSIAVPHHFPMPHDDVMEQGVNYNVPVAMFDELAAYDGSVIVERTKGEISARCDQEGANFLAVNLANDIVTGRRMVEDARAYYTRAMMTFKQAGTMDPYMQRLMFTPPATSGDPDHPAGKAPGGGMAKAERG